MDLTAGVDLGDACEADLAATASTITITGFTTRSLLPPWEGENYEPRNPVESGIADLELADVVGPQAEFRVGLGGDLIGASEEIEIIDVE
jgi:hypothetical protein